MKYWIKNAIAHLLYYSGMLHLYRRVRLRGKAAVLMYHRVLDERERRDSFSNDAIVVSPQTFERQVRFLKRHCQVLAPEEFERHLRERKPFPTGACLITFDDGWRDNYSNALPILRRYDAPAMIFLPISYIGTGKLFWQERLGRMLLWLVRNRPDGSRPLLDRLGLGDEAPGADPELRARIKAAANKLKAEPKPEIERVLDEAGRLVPQRLDVGPDVYLDWNEVAAMTRQGIAFGSHAVSHWPLTRVDDAQLDAELGESKRKLDEVFERSVEIIAYPNGDADEDVTERAAANGYAVGFTTRRGLAAVDDPPLAINRVNINEAVTRSMPLFYCRVLGLL